MWVKTKKKFFFDRIGLLMIFFGLVCLYYFSFNNFSNAIGDDDTIYFAAGIDRDYGCLNFMNFRSVFFEILAWITTPFVRSLGLNDWGAINSLRFFSALSGSLGILFLILLLRKIKVCSIAQYLCPLVLAVSAAYWKNSANGETYVPGLAAAVAVVYYAFLALSIGASVSKFIAVGVFSSLAIGFRVDNFLLIPLVSFMICFLPWQEHKDRIKGCLVYISTVIVSSFSFFTVFYFTLNCRQRMSNNLFYSGQHCDLTKYGFSVMTMIRAFPESLADFLFAGRVIVLVLAGLVMFVLIRYRSLRKELQSATVISLVWMGLFLFSYSWGACEEPETRTFYHFVPATIIGSVGYTFLSEQHINLKPVLRAFLCVTFFIVFCANALYISRIREDTYYKSAKCVMEHADDDMVVIMTNPDMARIGRYYFPDKSAIVLIEQEGENGYFIGKLTDTIKKYKVGSVQIVLGEEKKKFLIKHKELSFWLKMQGLSMVQFNKCTEHPAFAYTIKASP